MLYQGCEDIDVRMKPPQIEKGSKFPTEFALGSFSHRDVAVIRKITRESLGENYPPSLFIDINGWWPDGFIVVRGEDAIIAFIAGVVSAPRQARVLMLAVRKDYRNRGIGSALMAEFTKRCIARGITSIELEVRKSNAGAIKFYNRLGYSIRHLLPRFYTDKEDGYKMYKDIR